MIGVVNRAMNHWRRNASDVGTERPPAQKAPRDSVVTQKEGTLPAQVCTGDCYVCLRGLVKQYEEGVSAVNGVSLELAKGQLLALLGPSGCGKTTTLRLLAGFERLDAGAIDIGCQPVAGPGLHLPPEQRRIGMVFQEYALFPHLTIAENVRFGLHNYAGNKEKHLAYILELVGLDEYANRMPHELSGGQQQRVALARALAPEPNLILLDEPFSNLDAGLRGRLRADVRAILRRANATAIFVTHDQEEALSLVDVIAVMIDGVVQQLASPFELYQKPANRAVAEFIGNANFFPGSATGNEAECELGRLPTFNEVRGQVDVLIRPENISVQPASAESSSHVRDIIFYGHDQLVTIEMASGRLLDVRLLGPFQRYWPGQPVSITATGPVMAYPR